MTPASEAATSSSASSRISVLNAMISRFRGSVDASALRTSLRLTFPMDASLIGTPISLSSFARASSPPTVSDLMQTPSSSRSIERLASSSAAANAATLSSSDETTRSVVPTKTPSKDGALILIPAAA